MEHFAPPALFHIGVFPITNTLLTTLLVDTLVVAAIYFLNKHLSKIPNKFQSLIEIVIETFYDLTQSVAGKNASIIFPFFMSFFLFILLSNWIGILPGVGTIGFFEYTEHGKTLIPLFRGGTSDINTTLALALISVIATHFLSIKLTGIKDYLSRFFSINPIFLFVGILEIVSEFTKLISLSFRLFGNIFAGEVVLSTVGSIFAFGFPIPFLMLEMIVGLVQALVFGMLTMAFMSILTTPHHAEKHA
jgi:F-type H+-transporting ATPase subunit a